MAYDWHGEIAAEKYSREWFDAIDQRFREGARLFATDEVFFDRLMPFPELEGRRVLEIGCGMGLHTEMLVRAGAQVTAADLTETAVEATRKRLELKGLEAEVVQTDAERLPFDDDSYDFVWSWGVIHHSACTTRIVRQIARVLRADGECRVMVYNREGTPAFVVYLRDYLLKGAFLRGQTYDETLYRFTDGFTARYYPREQFEDLFRGFFEHVATEVCGQVADALPLPRQLRHLALRFVSDTYLRGAQAKRGNFLFLKARRPVKEHALRGGA
jgi:2-polyprenyl-3-methyl-5-hydroxy-6-metoxy-1,4-benzoquinol methylase